ncbi:ABC transporter permease [Bacteroides sp.]|uniref:ABC transporter permease n=1 Tax=Bacteroides sp. TaxID=29523 RepID=UPI0025C021B4|nr:ABC transporter permease [Bacteroides sp.]
MKHPLYSVLCRELRRMTSRRLYFGVCLVLPLFCLFFMATIFGSGQMENIPIGIVDQDNTATSRQIVRNISAVPTFKVTRHFTDETAARQAVQRKEIYGYLSIPTGFTQQATTGMDATLSYYYHYALLSVGSELMAAFETALAPVALSPIAMEAVSLGVSQEQITTFLLPVQSSMHPLYNPDLDYSIYLSQPFFYVLFQILILLITVYIIGSELKFHTAQEWLITVRGNILTAVVGKLLPYTFIFSVIGILANYILYGVLHIPFHGSLLMMNLMTILFIIATQALAVFIFSIFPRIAYIISIVSMVGSLGATLSGVTFPVTSMYPPVHAASYLFPVRHFTEIAQSMLYFDSGFGYYWQSAAILWLFPLVALLILPRLKHWILKDKEELSICEHETPLPRVHNTSHNSIATVIFREWRSISTNAAILLVLMGGIFAYGLLYNLMYAPNLVRKTPVAIVDNSHSALSREYIRLLNATPQASVYALTPNYLEAKEWLKQSKVDGILYLPADFDTRVGRGEQSVFTVYASTDAFLNFKNLQEASSRVMLAVNDIHRAEGAVFLPPQGLLAVASSAPVNVSGTALYNYTEGYGSYLIPAVMIIIIFQTLLMVIGMVTGEEAERKRLPTTSPYGYLPPLNSPVSRGRTTSRKEENSDSSAWRQALYNISGRTFVYVMLYFIFALFLLGLLPHFFSIPNIGNGRDIITMMIPFLLGTSFFGLAASRYFTDSEAPLLMIAFFSVGYIFLSGVSYPLELMPWYWQAAHYVVPAAPAVLAFVKLNSMGGTLADIRPEMITLWIQVIVYFLLSLWVFKKKVFNFRH